MRLIWLEAFLQVVEQDSFSAAGLSMGCDQSTITRYMNQLELWLGKVLLSNSVPVTLTDHGIEFVGIASEVLQLLNESRAKFKRVDKL
jgi:DNA-binding transcriptional LysR family regulator